jgi:hypothetical protein
MDEPQPWYNLIALDTKRLLAREGVDFRFVDGVVDVSSQHAASSHKASSPDENSSASPARAWPVHGFEEVARDLRRLLELEGVDFRQLGAVEDEPNGQTRIH